MATVSIQPLNTRKHFLGLATPLDVEGDGKYSQLPFVSSPDEGTTIIFYPQSTHSEIVANAKDLFGEELYGLLIEGCRDANTQGTIYITVSDEMADAVIQRLNESLADTIVCEYCFRARVLKDTRTCVKHQDQLRDNVARDQSNYAQLSIDMIISHVVEQVWPWKRRISQEDLFESNTTFRQAMLVQAAIGDHLPQKRWREVIDQVAITDKERRTVRHMMARTDSMIIAANPYGRLEQAQEVYVRMMVLILRHLKRWPHFPTNP